MSVTRDVTDSDNIRTISLAAGDEIEATPSIFYSQLNPAQRAARHTMPARRFPREERVGCVPVGRIEGSGLQFQKSREDFRDFDIVYRFATENLNSAERAPSIGIGRTEKNHAGGSDRRREMRDARIIADEYTSHPCDRCHRAE